MLVVGAVGAKGSKAVACWVVELEKLSNKFDAAELWNACTALLLGVAVMGGDDKKSSSIKFNAEASTTGAAGVG